MRIPTLLLKAAAASLFVSALLLATPPQGRSPIPKGTDRVVWTDRGDWVHLPFNPELSATVVTKGKSHSIRGPLGGANAWWVSKDRLYNLGSKGNGTEEHLWLFGRDLHNPKAEWERLQEVQTKSGIPLVLIPLSKDGTYLGINWMDGFATKGKASFVARFRRSNEMIVFDDCVDMPSPFEGLATRVQEVKPEPSETQNTRSSSSTEGRYECLPVNPALLPTLWAPAQVKDRLFLGSTQSGMVWVFNLDSGNCERVLNLVDSSKEDLPKLALLGHVLLSMQPTPDHMLLIATCGPEALNLARSKPASATRNTSDDDWISSLANQTDIQWLRVDPMTGKIDRVSSLYGLPANAQSFSQLSRFQFVLDSDGRGFSNWAGGWSPVQSFLGIGKTPEVSSGSSKTK
jgi:hypothetical protein